MLRPLFPSEKPLAAAYAKWQEHFTHCMTCCGSYASPDVICSAGKKWFRAWDALAWHSTPKSH